MRSPSHLPISIYTSEKGISRPWKLLSGLLIDLFARQSRELAWRMMVRNISARYRQSLLGILWLPLSAALTAFVWIFLNKTNVVNVGETPVPYPVFVLTGTVLWQMFAQGLSAPISAINSERSVLTKVNIPREALLLSSFGDLLFASAVESLILIPAFFLYKVELAWSMVLAPAALVMMVLLGFSVGLFVTPLGLIYQDVGRAIPVVARLWFFITPVVYPTPRESFATLVIYLNPVTPVICTAREWMTGQSVSQPEAVLIVAGGTVLLLLIGMLLYRLAMPIIVERMSA